MRLDYDMRAAKRRTLETLFFPVIAAQWFGELRSDRDNPRASRFGVLAFSGVTLLVLWVVALGCTEGLTRLITLSILSLGYLGTGLIAERLSLKEEWLAEQRANHTRISSRY